MKTAVEWFEGYLKKFNHIQESLSLRKAFEQAKEMEESQRKNDFIGGYLTHAMKKNKLPYGIDYLNKVADIEKQAEKLYNKPIN